MCAALTDDQISRYKIEVMKKIPVVAQKSRKMYQYLRTGQNVLPRVQMSYIIEHTDFDR